MKYFLFFMAMILILQDSNAQRITQTLNSSWQFSLDKSPDQTETVNIPHTWNSRDAFTNGQSYYRGTGTYTRQLYIPDLWSEKQLFLYFEGANQVVNLWVNEKWIGKHNGGYTGFMFNITNAVKTGTVNTLKITCNNSHNTDIPPLDADFNFYGGIYRDLWLTATDNVHFDMTGAAAGRLKITTANVSEKEAHITIEGTVQNHSDKPREIAAVFNIDRPNGEKETVIDQNMHLDSGESKSFSIRHTIDNPRLWSPEHPNLYALTASLSDPGNNHTMDKVSESFGCRWFNFDPENGFYLNGKHYKLIGVNRHQDFEGLGNALPNALHEYDYRKIKAMGSNFVRISHYPHDPEAYRMCDELGLLAWSEIPLVNDVTNTQAFLGNSLNMQKEHVLQFYNHPSVIMWGYMNEILLRMVFNRNMTDGEKEAKIESTLKIARALNKLTKELDHTRPTVMALHGDNIYNSTGVSDIPDLIGWNLYYGWYSPGLVNMGKFMDNQHARYPDRPIMISEYGPGSDVRIQTDDPKPWDYSEAYQLKSHISYLNQVKARPYIFGMTAWNYADFGSKGRQDAIPFINQKGLLNFDRSTKDIYHFYQAWLLNEPFVYIAGKYRKIRYCDDAGNGKGKVKLDVFSNQDSVYMFIDGGRYGAHSVKDNIATFHLELAEGKHTVEAITAGIKHCRTIKVRLRNNVLHTLQTQPLCINVGSHCDFTDLVTSEIWIHDQPYENGFWGYIGGTTYQPDRNKFQGTAINIKGTNNDPLFQTMREGIQAYRFDVEKGTYRIELLLAEPNRNAVEKLINNLNSKTKEYSENTRIFNISINDLPVVSDVNLAGDYGSGRALIKSLVVSTAGKIIIRFEPLSGKSVLSGIKIEQVN